MGNTTFNNIFDDKNLKSVFFHDKCDKYDYLTAAGCGAVAGIIDIFLVGAPRDSKLQIWTDAQVNKTVIFFAQKCGWSPKIWKKNSVTSAIGFLEKNFQVNYDQRHSGDIGNLFNMSAKNHHMKSLAHCPDIIGLFFSVLNQFTASSSFLHNGDLITIQTETYELRGSDFISKLFCGIANWFGHIMSDIAGSSGASGRGSGVVIPFYELFQLCDFGSFRVGKEKNTLALLATKVFQEGYDLRFGLTMAVPVLLCDLSIKLIWAIKHYFYYKKPFNECIPNKKYNDLRIMLLIGNGTLCLIDGADAAICSGGNWIKFFLRVNLAAWYRFFLLVFREVCIRLNINFSLQKQLNAYIRINEALELYLSELEQIDFERFQKETEQYNAMLTLIQRAGSEEELNILLKNEYKALGLSLPYHENFEEFMQDKSSILEFK